MLILCFGCNTAKCSRLAPLKEAVGSSLSTTRQRKCHRLFFMAGGPSLGLCEMSHRALAAEQHSLFRRFRDTCRGETTGPGLGKAMVKCLSLQGSWYSESQSSLEVWSCLAGRILGLQVLLWWFGDGETVGFLDLLGPQQVCFCCAALSVIAYSAVAMGVSCLVLWVFCFPLMYS